MKPQTLIINTNPLLNLVHEGGFAPGQINRIESLKVHAEGKGVNVARVLSRLGHRVTLTGFAGGHSGAWLRQLVRDEGICDRFIETRDPIRVGFMASSPEDPHPTTLLPNGFPVCQDACEELLMKVRELLQFEPIALVIISGSVPDPRVALTYRDLLNLAQEFAVPFWLDAHGIGAIEGLSGQSPPALAKPNRQEYAQTDTWDKALELHITDGAHPTFIRLPGGEWLELIPPNVRQVNPVGSGDCYLAGLAHGTLEGFDLEHRIRFAAAAGAANAMRPDVAQIAPEAITRLLSKSELTPVSRERP